mmetsp:Transcript_34963/g.42136  ORF Transcript_34963/g.42136 Transcript_34963/m.42136 type:complete len:279 (+) Transcript_34963:117-953(+)|eukprot:CAMPEP_0197852966 /NCGR_PEP_ID=MMETSP1438-20131217/21850_1 /TAXON_ID=1461541 /ORGANISM="Pterosperma sp., Strain CCMP1384" /LENGTH=278 /DNA_ID=CAMNT_0043467219 /DNA_START=117 /DNA_END=953 /DNA_ORIENTATION=-
MVQNGVLHDVGTAENANPKHRAQMEDKHVVENPFKGVANSAFLAVYDGHGGKEAADYAAETLHKNLMTELVTSPEISSDVGQIALERAYLTTDSQMKYVVPASCGTTAVTVLVTKKSETERFLHVANVGDARGVLCRDISAPELVAERLSIDHKPGEPSEKSRIEQCGGAVINHRVLGVLAVSRALGDHELKSLVCGQPHTSSYVIGGQPGILLLGCDGVFDVMSDQESVEFLAGKCKELQKDEPGGKGLADKLAKAIVAEAIRRSTRDNVTAIVALL